MLRKLTEKEVENRKYFERLALQNTDKEVPIDVFKSKFHLAMQNPVNKTITFDGIDRGLLSDGNISCLSEYFCKADGGHIFGQTVQELRITNVCLKSYIDYGYGYNHQVRIPDGTRYIAELIQKDPNIEKIDLSHTQLGDDEAEILLKALKENTKLRN